MIGGSNEHTRLYLEAVAPSIDGAAPLQGDAPGSCQWLRVPIPRGHVGVWDAEQFGEHGLAVQAYEFTDVDENDVIYAGEVAWIGERAPVEEAVAVIRRYLAGPQVIRGSHVEQRQL